MSGRKLAVALLEQTEKNGGYSNILLDSALERSDLDARDKRFCAALYYGTLERKIILDYIIGTYSKKPVNMLDSIVVQILRTGLYQLLYMEQIPDNAAVSESVKLTKKFRKASASGFVNAVLRGFIRDGKEIDYPEDSVQAASVRYSVPVWLVERMQEKYGEAKANAFFDDALCPPPLTVKLNSLASSESELLSALSEFEPTKHPFIEGAYILKKGGNIRKNKAFEKGLFHVQDGASQLCAMALCVEPGMTVLDMCAAPGGKTFSIAEYMENKGEIYAFDLQEQRAGLIAKGAERLHLTCIKAQAGNASIYNKSLPQADRVLCDVPCSGFGVIRRKPEIRYKSEEELQSLPDIQAAILENAARYVKTGGELIYSTCTVFREENENVVEAFLKTHPEFEGAPLLPHMGDIMAKPMVTLLPEEMGTDGFFMAKLKRIK